MVLSNEEYKLQGIGQLLVLENLLAKHEAIEFDIQATAEKLSLIQYLVKNNILSAQQIAFTAAQSFGVPLMDMKCININSIPINLVHDKLILQHLIIPIFKRANHLYLATDDPSKHTAIKEIQFHTGLHPNIIVVESDKLSTFIHRLISIKEMQNVAAFSTTGENEEQQHSEGYEANLTTEDMPIVEFVNKMIFDAIHQGASDIHFEPFAQEYRIRYRQDGILHEVARPPAHVSARIAARLKIMSHLDSSERRIPQDGALQIKIAKNRAIDFRVSTCPTTGGEKVVLRILNANSAPLGIDNLGFSPGQRELFIKAINRPQGMILVTGPTGSGKTVSLYAALHRLNTQELNISTAEDPVEIKIAGINQVNINPKAGLSFSRVLRALLRQDPDIIMVGEIRDLETADIAIKAAQTGHLVFSTLHTNSAAETLNRLVNMGIPRCNIVSSVTLIIAQRLARKLCDQCKVPRDNLSIDSLLELGFATADLAEVPLYKAVGCKHCVNGYKGRIGLFELLPMSQEISKLIMSGGTTGDILKRAQSAGMITLFAAGLEKVKQGLTSIEELNRVTVESFYG